MKTKPESLSFLDLDEQNAALYHKCHRDQRKFKHTKNKIRGLAGHVAVLQVQKESVSWQDTPWSRKSARISSDDPKKSTVSYITNTIQHTFRKKNTARLY